MKRAALYITLAAFTLVAAYPLFWTFACAGKICPGRPGGDAVLDPWSLPSPWTWDNFRYVLFESGFARCILNSVVVTAASVVLTLAAAALAGFAFGRVKGRWGKVLFFAMLAGMMVPVHIVLVPLLKLFSMTGLYGSRAGLVACYVATSLPVSVFILRGFFEGLPHELEEAARIDGCSDSGIFWHVALPLAKPALAVVAIYNAVTLWNEFVFALTLLNDPDHYTIPLGMYRFYGEHGSASHLPLVCAALSIAVLPMLVVYLLAQKHIIRGLTSGAVKG